MTAEQQADWLEEFIKNNRSRLKDDYVQNMQLIVATLRSQSTELKAHVKLAQR